MQIATPAHGSTYWPALRYFASIVKQAELMVFQWHPLFWQARRASNPQPSVLETDALPIELCPCSSLHSIPLDPALLDDLRDDAGADGLAALADGKAQA